MTVTRTVWGFIERRDHRLMRRMNRWRAPRWIRYWMIAATRMGDGWLWYGLGAMLLVYGGGPKISGGWAAGFAGLFLIPECQTSVKERPRARPRPVGTHPSAKEV